jgi:predicted enzyme related to lactoylglutathione lyase
MGNRVVHFEIHASNPVAVIDFYTKVFGWQITKWEGGEFEYWMIMTGERDEAGGINGGLIRRSGEIAASNSPQAFVCTIMVDNFDAYTKKIIAAGGSVALPKMAIGGMAWQGYFKDTDGNLFGLHQIDPQAH